MTVELEQSLEQRIKAYAHHQQVSEVFLVDDIQQNVLIVMVLDVDHRGNSYR
jgi:hypothetical protein